MNNELLKKELPEGNYEFIIDGWLNDELNHIQITELFINLSNNKTVDSINISFCFPSVELSNFQEALNKQHISLNNTTTGNITGVVNVTWIYKIINGDVQLFPLFRWGKITNHE